MHEGQGDLLWDAFVLLMLTAGAVQERDSRYGDKPALVAGNHEIAHLEAPGVIDLGSRGTGGRGSARTSATIPRSAVTPVAATGSSCT
jgi:hypothetical protein